MRKHFTTISMLILSSWGYSQVGINNSNPHATFDITAKTTDGSKPEGFLPPRLSGDEIKAGDALYTSQQTGTIVYATAAVSASSTKTVNITSAGYYYYDGNLWQKISTGGAYTANNGLTLSGASLSLGGQLTGNTTINQNGSQIIFSGQGSMGIGATSPDNSARLDVSSTTQGFLPPRMTTTERDAISSPAAGLIVYNTTENCINYRGSNNWQSLCGVQPVVVTALTCGSAVTSGTLTSGSPASGVSSSVPYTGGNGAAYASQSVTSTGVTGLTATLSAGTLNNGNGNVTYTITGTAASSGTASFAISLGGKGCTLNIPVSESAPVVTNLNCGSATTTGTLTSGSAASGVSSSVPYTGGNTGTYTSQSFSSTGVTGLTATLSAGNLNNGNGNVTYSITGIPASAGTAAFVISLGGKSCTLNIPVNAAPHVTALNCGSATRSGTLTSGSAASGVSSSVPYTGGNGIAYAGQSFNSTGVTGLTATLSAGTLNNGNGNVNYIISGTPTSSGTASFVISLGGQNCQLNIPVNAPSPLVTALNCGSAITSGTLTSGSAASGVSSSVPYTGGNGIAYAGQSVNSTGITGLTATISAGTLNNGNGNVTYTITGTPSSSGTAHFQISLGGKSCQLDVPVNAPPRVTAFNCGSAITSGTLTSGSDASGVSSTVSYTGGNGAPYVGQSINSTGVTGLTAVLSGGTLNSGNGNVSYIITGTPTSSGTAHFQISLGGQSCQLNIPVNMPPPFVTALNCDSATTTGQLHTNSQYNASSGMTFTVPYTGGNTGAYGSESVSAYGADSTLIATRPAGTLANGNGSVTYTITGQTYNVGGTLAFNINLGGKSCTVSLFVSPF